MPDEIAIRTDADDMLPAAGLALRFDAGAVGKLERTPTGGVRAPARVTREGVLVYQRADGSTVREYRPADEVFAAASLASLADCAVTIAHPAAGKVTPQTFRRDAVGYVAGEGRRDATFVGATLVVQDADAIARIDAGDLGELSCGYVCRLDMTPGTTPSGERYDAVQRGISYNHVALLPRGGGRAGREVALRLDGAAVAIDDRPTDNAPRAPETTRTDSMKTERIDGVDYIIGSAEWQQAHAKRMTRLDATADELKATVAELEKQLEAAKAELAGMQSALDSKSAELAAATDEKKLDAKLTERSALVTQARTVLGTAEKLDGKTADEIRRAVITKLDGSASVEGKDAAFVAAFFVGRMAAVSTAQLAQHRADASPAPTPGGAPAVDLSRYLVRPGHV